MFNEPLVITIDGAANSLKRVDFKPSRFALPSGDIAYNIDQQVNKSAERFNVQLVRNLVAADPLNPTILRSYQRKYWVGSSGPLNGIGISDVQAEKDMKGLLTYLVSGTVLASLFGGES